MIFGNIHLPRLSYRRCGRKCYPCLSRQVGNLSGAAPKGGSSDGGMVHSPFSRKGIKVVCAAKLPRPFRGGGRGRGPFERLRNFLENYFVMHFFLKKHLSSCVYQRNFVSLSPYSFRVNLENDSKTTRRRHDSISIKINHNYYGKSRF